HVGVRRPPEAAKLEIVEVKEEAEKAAVRAREAGRGGAPAKETTLDLVKTAAGWRLLPPHDDPAFGEAVTTVGLALHDALLAGAREVDALAADVAAGRAAKDDVPARFAAI